MHILTNNARQAGFTLIEIMVVIMIIGIVAGLATLSVGQGPGRVVQDEAQRLQSLLTLANEEAVLQSEELAIEVYKNGYRFLVLNQAEVEWQWEALQGHPVLRPRCFAQGITMVAEIEGMPASLEQLDCAAEAVQADKKKSGEDDTTSSAPKKAAKKSAEEDPPRIFLLSSGEMTPFEMTLILPDKSNPWQVLGEITGKLVVQNPSNDSKRS